MPTPDEFSFGDDAVASAYDDVLVPILFQPWAVALISEHQPWAGNRILDLATGTGVLAHLLAEKVGPDGHVVGSDVNREMLARAKARCEECEHPVAFVEAPAESLGIPSESFDVVVCQQGFQFFPQKSDAAAEIHRVLCSTGRTVVTTWRPVSECHFFGAICDALESIGETELSQMMRVPFDFLSAIDLASHFGRAGFDKIRVTQRDEELTMHGGVAHAVRAAYSTPIGPDLSSLPEHQQKDFKGVLTGLLRKLSSNGSTFGQMASNVLTAERPQAARVF